MKAHRSTVWALILLCSIAASAGTYSGGNGTTIPYQIGSTADWQELTATPADWDKSFVLTAHVNLANVSLTPVGSSSAPFNGTFDGNGLTISNATISLTGSDYVGLFGYVGSGGQIKNTGVENAAVEGHDYVGGLAGRSYGTIESCCVTGSVSGNAFVGGLAGMNYASARILSCSSTCQVNAAGLYAGGLAGSNASDSKIELSWATGSVNGTNSVGGLAGINSSSRIFKCYATGNVTGNDNVGGLVGYNQGEVNTGYATGTVSGRWYVGGLVGGNYYETVSLSFATGSVSGTEQVGGLAGRNSSGRLFYCQTTSAVTATASSAGGLIGYNSGIISFCQAAGIVSGTDYIGGLVGRISNTGSVTSCCAKGAASGNVDVGGLVGWNDRGKVVRSYSTGRPTGASNVGGLCGFANTASTFYEDTGNVWDAEASAVSVSAMGIGKTTAQMQTVSTFTDLGWDFSADDGDGQDWRMPSEGYPIQAWKKYSGGDGLSQAWAYRISLKDDWAELMTTPADWAGKYFIVTADIDLFGLLVTPVGNSATPFSGVLDGSHHVMDRLVMNLPQSMDTGLFGVLSASAEISNLGVNAIFITGFNYIGVLAGHNSGTISSCYTTGTISGGGGPYIYQGTMGGLVGHNTGAIDSCWSTAAVSNAGRIYGSIGSVGGLTGYNGGTLTDCYAAGTINANESFTGGLAGWTDGPITDCYAAGTVSAGGEFTITGGLAGYCRAGVTVTNCHAKGAVEGPEGTGGLIGYCEQNVTVTGCYATGTVTGHDYYAGGLIAYVNAGTTINNCYATGNVSGPRYVGGLAGHNAGTIEDCSAAGAASGGAQIGGLVGINSGAITACFAAGDVGTYYCGGLVGQNDGVISVCYATGNVYGQHDIGGLVWNNSGSITACYSTGSVQAFDPPVGGLIAVNGQALTGCFWNTETSGTLQGVGEGTTTGITGKTTAQMKMQATFIGWDFAGTWFMPFDSYPHLRWDLYSAGSGTAAEPYRISCVDDLYDMMGLPEDWDMQFVLTADLDLASVTFDRALIAPDTSTFSGFQGTVFCGVFDGAGHVIENLTIDARGQDYQGLFGFVGQTLLRGKGGVIRDLGLVNAVVTGGDYTGSLAGKIHHGSVSGSFSTGSVSSDGSCAGGLIGYLGPGSAELWTCAVSDSYSKSTVDAAAYAGGLIGVNYQSQIERCYSIGRVDAPSYCGGLVGSAVGGTISSSYFHVKAGPNNGLGTALSTLQFKQQSSFSGWDFSEQWGICESTNYPRLQWQIPLADLACPDGITLPDFAHLAARWMAGDCAAPDYCARADIDLSGDVGLPDILLFSESWMQY